MKTKHNFALTFILLLLIGITSCGIKSPGIYAKTPTRISIPPVTQAPRPTSTISPSPRPTPTIIPTSVNLDDAQWEQQQNYIIALLETNQSNCKLPCLWGIAPGKTIRLDAEKILNNAGIVTFDNTHYLSPTLVSVGWTLVNIHGTINFPEGLLQTDVDFNIHNGIVDYITVNSPGIYSLNDKIPAFRKMWENYSPEKLIPELGIPSRVEIYSSIFPGEGRTTGSFYIIYIFYDTQGILLEYTVNDDLNSLYKICPIFGKGGNTEDSITMILKSPNDGIPIENYEPNYNSTFLTLENAAGITTEEFYKLFLQDGKPACFNALPSALPMP